ncbi:MAG: PilZ domain-containing protein [Candidatus Omnitrophica bacterium]|nr:PilZ domain-containing protein [Candidatus Omnitrophota bacterium]
MDSSERRRYPRIESQLELKLVNGGADIFATSVNISRSGVLCVVNQELTLMTKYRIAIELPFGSGDKASRKWIKCEGVVVRVQTAEPGSWHIAIFFSDMKESDSKLLREYVDTHQQQQGY